MFHTQIRFLAPFYIEDDEGYPVELTAEQMLKLIDLLETKLAVFEFDTELSLAQCLHHLLPDLRTHVIDITQHVTIRDGKLYVCFMTTIDEQLCCGTPSDLMNRKTIRPYLDGLKADLNGQISDGWGENFSLKFNFDHGGLKEIDYEDEGISLSPGSVRFAEVNGEPRLASEAIPMAAYPQLCDWTDESFGKLNLQYKTLVNTLYQQWLGNARIEPVHVIGDLHKPDSAELLKEIEQLRKFKKNVERCLETEYQKLYQAGFVKAMMASHEDGTFQFDLNLDCPLREELAKANYWKRYYEDKYLALLPDEERNPPPQAKC